jgi:hypothetical protein
MSMRAAAGLNHQHIVTVYDAGLAEEGVYIAMERLQGRDLRQLLADGWRPDPVQAARIAKRLADALAYAHGHGVVHCDIKPANVFMTGRTQPKLLDFGIARVTAGRYDAAASPLDISAETSTVPPPELGSPYYVSPEHLRGEPLDARADVYGVGVVLYELITGRRAFDGDSLESIRHAVLEAPVAPAHTVNPKVDAALSGIAARAMARNPGDRYRSARQLSRALRTWISDETNGLGHKPRGSHAGYLWAAGGTVALVLSVAAWMLMPRGGDALAARPAPPPASTQATVDAVSAVVAPAPTPTSVIAAPSPALLPDLPRAAEPPSRPAVAAVAVKAPPRGARVLGRHRRRRRGVLRQLPEVLRARAHRVAAAPGIHNHPGLSAQQAMLKDETGAMFVVTDTQVSYLRPARLDDLLDVTVQVRPTPAARRSPSGSRPGATPAAGRRPHPHRLRRRQRCARAAFPTPC